MNDPIKWLETSLMAIAAFNLFLLFTRVLFSFRQFQPANGMLLGWLFITGLALAMMYIIDTGIIFKIPWLYRLPSPLYYLLFPFAYLYVRLMVSDKRMPSKWDSIHLIPAIFHTIEMMPFFLMPESYKLELLLKANNPLEAFTHNEGILLSYQHNILRGILGIGYAMAMFRILYDKKRKKNEHLHAYPEILKWLKAFTWIQILLGLVLVTFLGFPQLAPPAERATFIYILLAIVQSGAAIILFFNPIILYGIPKLSRSFPVSPLPSEGNTLEEAATLPQPEAEIKVAEIEIYTPIKAKSDKEQVIIDRLENLMATQKPYLQNKLSANEIAKKLEIPLHHLSYLLNHVMYVRFTDYINEKRIKYMNDKIRQEGMHQYTLEAIAFASGFNSRITFIRAVKKLKGINPSEYFGKHIDDES